MKCCRPFAPSDAYYQNNNGCIAILKRILRQKCLQQEYLQLNTSTGQILVYTGNVGNEKKEIFITNIGKIQEPQH